MHKVGEVLRDKNKHFLFCCSKCQLRLEEVAEFQKHLETCDPPVKKSIPSPGKERQIIGKQGEISKQCLTSSQSQLAKVQQIPAKAHNKDRQVALNMKNATNEQKCSPKKVISNKLQINVGPSNNNNNNNNNMSNSLAVTGVQNAAKLALDKQHVDMKNNNETISKVMKPSTTNNLVPQKTILNKEGNKGFTVLQHQRTINSPSTASKNIVTRTNNQIPNSESSSSKVSAKKRKMLTVDNVEDVSIRKIVRKAVPLEEMQVIVSEPAMTKPEIVKATKRLTGSNLGTSVPPISINSKPLHTSSQNSTTFSAPKNSSIQSPRKINNIGGKSNPNTTTRTSLQLKKEPKIMSIKSEETQIQMPPLVKIGQNSPLKQSTKIRKISLRTSAPIMDDKNNIKPSHTQTQPTLAQHQNPQTQPKASIQTRQTQKLQSQSQKIHGKPQKVQSLPQQSEPPSSQDSKQNVQTPCQPTQKNNISSLIKMGVGKSSDTSHIINKLEKSGVKVTRLNTTNIDNETDKVLQKLLSNGAVQVQKIPKSSTTSNGVVKNKSNITPKTLEITKNLIIKKERHHPHIPNLHFCPESLNGCHFFVSEHRLLYHEKQ